MNDASRPRWLLLAILLLLPWTAVLLLNYLPALERWSFAGTFAGVAGVMLTLLLGAIWVLCFSRLRWPVRWRALAGILLFAGGAAALVRKDGHMGDFLPQLAWRWQPRPGETVGALQVRPHAAVRFTTDAPGDSARFLGSRGLNDEPSPALAPDWHASAPRELWRREVGLGWSGFIVCGECAITMEQRGDQEMTVAYHVRTGEPLWAHAVAARFSEPMGGDGPRATPTAQDGRVYSLGATGVLSCLEGATGRLIWQRNTLTDAGHSGLTWAKSCSPLLAGKHVIVTLGKGPQTLAAYAADTGEPAWRSGPEEASYGSPILATMGGREQVIAVFANQTAGFDPATGAELWKWPMKGAPANVANPVILGGDRVLVGIGYGVGTTLIRPGPGAVEEVWHTLKLKPKFTNVIVRGNRVWGLDEGRLVCVDTDTGTSLWRGTSYGHGQITGAGDSIIIQTERGSVAIAAMSSEGEQVRTTFPALTSKTWNQPCLAGNLLLTRNDREAVCFELKAGAGGVSQ